MTTAAGAAIVCVRDEDLALEHAEHDAALHGGRVYTLLDDVQVGAEGHQVQAEWESRSSGFATSPAPVSVDVRLPTPGPGWCARTRGMAHAEGCAKTWRTGLATRFTANECCRQTPGEEILPVRCWSAWMDSDAVLVMFDRQMRRGARADGPGVRVERIGDVVRQVGADRGWSGVVWSDVDQDTADTAIAAQVEHFTSIGHEFEWKLYAHDRPDDLAGRLRAAGFTPGPEETLMVAQVRDLPTNVELPEGVHLRPVTDPAGVDLVADVHEQAFGTGPSPIRHRLLAQLAEAPDSVAAVVAMAGHLPVCAARMELHPGT
jgi:hypothetical protein